MSLIVDREKHEYWDDGEKLISITDCMKEVGIIRNVMVSDFHLWVGTAAHRAIELWIRGTLNLETLDPRLKSRLDAWIEFERVTGFKAIGSEHSMRHPHLPIAGTLDLLGHFPDGKEGIVELKSGTVPRWAGVQTAGQDILLGGDRRQRFGLKVPESGKPTVTSFKNPADYDAFMAAVTLVMWSRK